MIWKVKFEYLMKDRDTDYSWYEGNGFSPRGGGGGGGGVKVLKEWEELIFDRIISPN